MKFCLIVICQKNVDNYSVVYGKSPWKVIALNKKLLIMKFYFQISAPFGNMRSIHKIATAVLLSQLFDVW